MTDETKDQPGHTGGVLLELAERCEKATGPDRIIDALIWELGPCELPDCLPDVKARLVMRILSGGDDPECPRYTASLDSAMTLVLEGWRPYTADFSIKGRFSWMLSRDETGRKAWHERNPLALEESLAGIQHDDDPLYITGVGKTAVTGLLAASLGARAALSLARDAADRRVTDAR